MRLTPALILVVCNAAAQGLDPSPMPMYPARPPLPLAAPGLPPEVTRFAAAYRSLGSPRIAILYNRSLGEELASWTIDSKRVFREVDSAGREYRAEGFTEYQGSSPRTALPSDYANLAFGEGFARPFLAAGACLVDADTVIQAAPRDPARVAGSAHSADLNVNIDALRKRADWLVRLSIVSAANTPAGFGCQATVVSLAEGRVIGVILSGGEDLAPVTSQFRIVARHGGYFTEPCPRTEPTIEQYAQAIALDLLRDIDSRLGN